MEVIIIFQHGAPDVIVQWFRCGEIEGHSVFSMNPFAFSQFYMTLKH